MPALVIAALIQGWSLPAARPCDPTETAALLAPAEIGDPPYRLRCRARLTAGQAVARRILFEGAEASGAGIDCGGGALGRAATVVTTATPTVAVWSARIPGTDAPVWSRPTDILISNCTVYGSVRLHGMDAGGGYDDQRASSRRPGHTARAQAAAPSHVRLEGVTVVGTGSIPVYVGPGVTAVTIEGSRVTGVSDSVALYLDAESTRVSVGDTAFDVRTGREQIAIDGSAHNRLVGNRFRLGGRGGVFLYRNCGERGVVRHQTPSFNTITDNVFDGAGLGGRAVVVGAREGRRSYCGEDAGLPFGSSSDDGDNATGNVVARNTVRR